MLIVCEVSNSPSQLYRTGALRGAEMDRLGDSSKWQILFGLLRFESRSNKGESHGRTKNKSVEHFMSPSLTRCAVIVEFLLRHNLISGVIWPEPETIKPLVCKFFADIFRLKNDILNTKQMRDVIALVTDYAQPRYLGKLSTSPQLARTFHHSVYQHDSAYAGKMGELDSDGRLTESGILLAREMNDILGEPRSGHPTTRRASASHQPRAKELNAAAAYAYKSAGAKVYGPQYELVMEVLTGSRNSIAHLGCGVGKSGGWILPLMHSSMISQVAISFMLVSPYKALVNQHAQQARESFEGTPLTVRTLTTAECESVTLNDLQANLIVVSVAGLLRLRTHHEELLKQSPIKVCFVDEVHNVAQELFRVETWSALKNLASLGWKLYLLTATTNNFLSKCLSDYIGKHDQFNIIGHSGEGYRIPNIALEVSKCRRAEVLTAALQIVKEYFSQHSGSVKVQIVSPTIKQAEDLAQMFCRNGIMGEALTSETPAPERKQIMYKWRHDQSLRVLVSTLTDGIDSSMVQMVVIMETAGSIFRLIQAMGRIRPLQQVSMIMSFSSLRVPLTHVCAFFVHYPGWDTVKDSLLENRL